MDLSVKVATAIAAGCLGLTFVYFRRFRNVEKVTAARAENEEKPTGFGCTSKEEVYTGESTIESTEEASTENITSSGALDTYDCVESPCDLTITKDIPQEDGCGMFDSQKPQEMSCHQEPAASGNGSNLTNELTSGILHLKDSVACDVSLQDISPSSFKTISSNDIICGKKSNASQIAKDVEGEKSSNKIIESFTLDAREKNHSEDKSSEFSSSEMSFDDQNSCQSFQKISVDDKLVNHAKLDEGGDAEDSISVLNHSMISTNSHSYMNSSLNLKFDKTASASNSIASISSNTFDKKFPFDNEPYRGRDYESDVVNSTNRLHVFDLQNDDTLDTKRNTELTEAKGNRIVTTNRSILSNEQPYTTEPGHLKNSNNALNLNSVKQRNNSESNAKTAMRLDSLRDPCDSLAVQTTTNKLASFDLIKRKLIQQNRQLPVLSQPIRGNHKLLSRFSDSCDSLLHIPPHDDFLSRHSEPRDMKPTSSGFSHFGHPTTTVSHDRLPKNLFSPDSIAAGNSLKFQFSPVIGKRQNNAWNVIGQRRSSLSRDSLTQEQQSVARTFSRDSLSRTESPTADDSLGTARFWSAEESYDKHPHTKYLSCDSLSHDSLSHDSLSRDSLSHDSLSRDSSIPSSPLFEQLATKLLLYDNPNHDLMASFASSIGSSNLPTEAKLPYRDSIATNKQPDDSSMSQFHSRIPLRKHLLTPATLSRHSEADALSKYVTAGPDAAASTVPSNAKSTSSTTGDCKKLTSPRINCASDVPGLLSENPSRSYSLLKSPLLNSSLSRIPDQQLISYAACGVSPNNNRGSTICNDFSTYPSTVRKEELGAAISSRHHAITPPVVRKNDYLSCMQDCSTVPHQSKPISKVSDTHFINSYFPQNDFSENVNSSRFLPSTSSNFVLPNSKNQSIDISAPGETLMLTSSPFTRYSHQSLSTQSGLQTSSSALHDEASSAELGSTFSSPFTGRRSLRHRQKRERARIFSDDTSIALPSQALDKSVSFDSKRGQTVLNEQIHESITETKVPCDSTHSNDIYLQSMPEPVKSVTDAELLNAGAEESFKWPSAYTSRPSSISLQDQSPLLKNRTVVSYPENSIQNSLLNSCTKDRSKNSTKFSWTSFNENVCANDDDAFEPWWKDNSNEASFDCKPRESESDAFCYSNKLSPQFSEAVESLARHPWSSTSANQRDESRQVRAPTKMIPKKNDVGFSDNFIDTGSVSKIPRFVNQAKHSATALKPDLLVPPETQSSFSPDTSSAAEFLNKEDKPDILSEALSHSESRVPDYVLERKPLIADEEEEGDDCKPDFMTFDFNRREETDVSKSNAILSEVFQPSEALARSSQKQEITAKDLSETRDALKGLAAFHSTSANSKHQVDYSVIASVVIANLERGLDDESALSSLQVISRLASNPDAVPHILASKAPVNFFDLLDPFVYSEETISTWLKILSDILWSSKENSLTYSCLPKSSACKHIGSSLYTALYGWTQSNLLKTRLQDLTAHRNSTISRLATDVYSCLASS